MNLSRKTTVLCLVSGLDVRLMKVHGIQNGSADHALKSVRGFQAIETDGSKSPELKTLSNKFIAFHGASYASAIATLATSIGYAMFLAERCL